MGRQRGEIEGMRMVCRACFVIIGGVKWAGSVRFTMQVGLALALMLVCVVGLAGATQAAESCQNEARRVEQGSTYLPDCRAYELVTPAEKGATQALNFGGPVETTAIPAEDGEKIALSTKASHLGGNPSSEGTHVVFSRSASGWEMTSLQPPAGAGEVNFVQDVFTSELTQVGVLVYSEPGPGAHSPTDIFEVGPPGGPYSEVATTPYTNNAGAYNEDALVGTSSDFNHLVLRTRAALSPAAVGTDPNASDLYDFTDGQLHLVNVGNAGALLGECGAVLGGGRGVEAGEFYETRAVWGEGASSKVFFTSPEASGSGAEDDGPGCTFEVENPHRLYMRVNDSETVEVSAPQLEEADGKTAVPCDSGTYSAHYQGASADGSEVFFTTKGELTPDDIGCHKPGDEELYEYNTVTRKLIRISRGEEGTPFSTAEGKVIAESGGSPAIVSEDGSAVYFWAERKLTEDAFDGANNLYRYDTVTGKIRFVAASLVKPADAGEQGYATPSGEFFLFVSQSVYGEPRGSGDNELYLYDNSDGKVMCVSCGSGIAPAHGAAYIKLSAILRPEGLTPPFIPMSEDGRYVFFDSDAQLVPQDTEQPVESGMVVYEWEADGTGGCVESNGCTHLITSGTSGYASTLLGASRDGSNVFFATYAALVPQDTDTQPDIYDARIDGGFVAPVASVRCAGEACRLIPSAPPVISTPLSATFSGVGNIAPVLEPASVAKSKPLSRARKLANALNVCGKEPRKKRARCKAQARRRYGAKAAKSAAKGDR